MVVGSFPGTDESISAPVGAPSAIAHQCSKPNEQRETNQHVHD